jgi:hypothetical protein
VGKPSMGFGTAPKTVAPRVPLRHGEGDKDHLTSFGGLAALSLDALSSVAYGPEGIVLVLVAAGSSALLLTLPVTLAIVGLLRVLVVSYCQVIAVHPDGGGAYASTARTGHWSTRSSTTFGERNKETGRSPFSSPKSNRADGATGSFRTSEVCSWRPCCAPVPTSSSAPSLTASPPVSPAARQARGLAVTGAVW